MKKNSAADGENQGTRRTSEEEEGATATTYTSVHIRRSRLLLIMTILATFAAAVINEIRGEDRIDGIELEKVETTKRSLRTPHDTGITFQDTNQVLDVTADAQHLTYEIAVPGAKDSPNHALNAFSHRDKTTLPAVKKDSVVRPIGNQTSSRINHSLERSC